MEEFKYSNSCKFSTVDLWEALLLQIQVINSTASPLLSYRNWSEQVTCCPCVVWNSWATAAKASELGSCGTVGTEFAVTCGASEGTLAGGGGEPEGSRITGRAGWLLNIPLAPHSKGLPTTPCLTPRADLHHPSCIFWSLCRELLGSLLTPALGHTKTEKLDTGNFSSQLQV